MTPKIDSTAIISRILAAVAALALMSGCGGGGGGTTTPPPVPGISLSVASLTFASQSVGTPSAPQSITVNSTGTGALILSGIARTGDFTQTNNCGTTVNPGSSCVINVTFTPTASGARTGTLTITDNVTTSPQTVPLNGTGAASTVSLSTSSLTFPTQIMVGTPSASQSVTITNTGAAVVTIAGIAASGDFSESGTCGVTLSSGGSCAINVTLTPSTTGPLTGTLTITDDSNGVAGTMQSVALSGSGFTNNAVAVNVNFGPNGNLGLPSATSVSYYNGIFTTVTICAPGTTTCATIPNVLVDTGSVGLRVLSNQMGSVVLPQINDGSGDYLYECVEYGDTSYNWGPVELATVQIGGETATQVPGQTVNSGVPIQVITANVVAPSVAPCTSGGGPSDSTVALLGANGILGVANYAQDCGSGCTSTTTAVSPYPYITCNTSSCSLATVGLDAQVTNPVSAFLSADTNGVILQLPSIPAAGQDSVAGTLVFGIETETCPGAPTGCTPNLLGSAQVYGLDAYANFSKILFNGLTYSSPTNPGYLDSGSNGLYISDHASLGISDCLVGTTNIGYYCPAPALNLTGIVFTDLNNVSSPSTAISIGNALSLFSANPSFAAFNNLGGDGGTSLTNDSFDFGLPFFFGRNVYVGIQGSPAPNGANVPNGYFAF